MSYTLNQLPWLANFADLTFTIVFSDVICQCEVDNQWGSWHKLMHHKWYCLLTDSLLASLLIYLSRVLFARRGSNIVRKESTTWMDPLKTSSDKSYCVRTSQNIAIKYHKAKSTLISERTKENSDCFITLGFCCEKKNKINSLCIIRWQEFYITRHSGQKNCFLRNVKCSVFIKHLKGSIIVFHGARGIGRIKWEPKVH